LAWLDDATVCMTEKEYRVTSGLQTTTNNDGILQDARGLLFLVVAVFFLFGGITNVADLLVSKLKGLFQLNYAQAMLVQFAFFTSYAIFSIPAGLLMKRLGYFRGIMIGFAIMIAACLLFLPATWSGQYAPFLAALFVLGGGITLLQVAVNPLIISLGPSATAHSRLTFAQFFNSVGVFLIVTFGATIILGETANVDPATLSGAALATYRITESAIIGQAYLGLAAVLAAVMLLFWVFRGNLERAHFDAARLEGAFGLLRNRQLALGCLCIFVYVGAEVGIASIMVSYLKLDRTLASDAVSAGHLLGLYWAGAMVGRMIGGFVLRLAAPGKVLAVYAAGAIALVAISAFGSGTVAGYALVLVGFTNSIMFPTIFSLATEGLMDEAPQASGLLCTAIVGGAIVPYAMGCVADLATLTTSLIVPVACYSIIGSFGLWAARRPVTALGA
jgi:MFS transporter, FHS family, L-fucose permease